jgi:hypothetical protein
MDWKGLLIFLLLPFTAVKVPDYQVLMSKKTVKATSFTFTV